MNNSEGGGENSMLLLYVSSAPAVIHAFLR